MSSPSTTASSIPTTPTTPFSLPSPVPFDAPMTMQSSSSSMPYLALPPPVAVRPRRYALHPSFKLQPPPISLKSRTTIIEEQEDEEGCTKIEIHVPSISAMSDKTPTRMDRPTLVLPPSSSSELAVSPSATRPNKTFADAVAGRNPPPAPTPAPAPAPIASSSTMNFGKLSGQPRSTRAGARTHRRAQSISMSVSDSVGFVRRTGSDAQEAGLMGRRPASLTPSSRMVHFATIPESESESPRASLHPRAAHPRVSALAPPHPGLRSASYGLAPPSRFTSREESTPRAFANSGRIIALPSFEDDAFTSMRGSSSYAFGANPVAIAVGRGFEQWGQ